MMEQETIRFEQKDNDIFVYGCPELNDCKGVVVGDGIAFFFGEGWRNYELYIANTITGKIRKLSTTVFAVTTANSGIVKASLSVMELLFSLAKAGEIMNYI